MTQDEIIEMARQAGWPDWEIVGMKGELKAFAKLVAAKEREACAMVCETTVWSKSVTWWTEVTKTEVSAYSGQQCADAIRARGEA